jgi:hypothetical protein
MQHRRSLYGLLDSDISIDRLLAGLARVEAGTFVRVASEDVGA